MGNNTQILIDQFNKKASELVNVNGINKIKNEFVKKINDGSRRIE